MPFDTSCKSGHSLDDLLMFIGKLRHKFTTKIWKKTNLKLKKTHSHARKFISDVCTYICMCLCMSMCLYRSLHFCLSIYVNVCLALRVFVCLSVFVYLSVSLLLSLSLCMTVCGSGYICACLHVCVLHVCLSGFLGVWLPR